jgi:hypothetical protein
VFHVGTGILPLVAVPHSFTVKHLALNQTTRENNEECFLGLSYFWRKNKITKKQPFKKLGHTHKDFCEVGVCLGVVGPSYVRVQFATIVMTSTDSQGTHFLISGHWRKCDLIVVEVYRPTHKHTHP